MKYRQSSFLLIILFHGIFDFLTRTFAFQTPQFASSACSHYLTRLSNLDHSQSTTRCFASAEEEEATNYDEEETLLKIHLSVLPVVSMDAAMERVSAYCRSFPFAAVLPVQPLTYLPNEDGGVDVRFLRKKTKEKGSLDGGIRFLVTQADQGGIDVVAKRNSQGQTISKMFSEKLVVQAFVKGISGQAPDKTSPAPIDVVALRSVFHKWLGP